MIMMTLDNIIVIIIIIITSSSASLSSHDRIIIVIITSFIVIVIIVIIIALSEELYCTCVDQILTLLSLDPVAINFASGLYETVYTGSLCPVRERVQLPVSFSQTRTTPSKEALKMKRIKRQIITSLRRNKTRRHRKQIERHLL